MNAMMTQPNKPAATVYCVGLSSHDGHHASGNGRHANGCGAVVASDGDLGLRLCGVCLFAHQANERVQRRVNEFKQAAPSSELVVQVLTNGAVGESAKAKANVGRSQLPPSDRD